MGVDDGFILSAWVLWPPAAPIGPTRFFISAAIVKNACSTFVDVLADVSRNWIPTIQKKRKRIKSC